MPPRHNSRHDQLLENLKLNAQSAGEIEPVLNQLLQLGYAGQLDTQQVFAKAMYYALTKNAESVDSNHLRNRSVLFGTTKGRDVLSRLIFSSSWNDKETSTDSLKALNNLCSDFDGV